MDTATVTIDEGADPRDDALISMKGIRKSFGGVPVLVDVDFEVREGEVHALAVATAQASQPS